MTRPVRLAISLGGPADTPAFARALARVERAEALSLHSVWLPEGHFQRGALASPLVLLAAFAARTRHIGLGTTSLLLPIHHPLRVAQEVATVDALSRGRVLLGLGRGFRAPVFEGFGVRAREKRDRFDAALDAILALWREGHAADRTSAQPGFRIAPVQRPHPPLFVAAFGPKGLTQAARRGLPYLASPLETLGTLRENYAFHAEHLPDGVERSRLPVAVLRTVYVAKHDAEAARVLAALDTERRRSVAAVSGALARAAAGELHERVIVGTRNRVADTIAAYREAIGLDLLIARTEVPGSDETERAGALERLATEVAPQLA